MRTMTLYYRRVGEKFEGVLSFEDDVGGAVFNETSFADMMTLVSSRIISEGVTTFQLQRTDREGLAMVTMEPKMLELLVSDVAEYIRLHSPPTRRVVVRGNPAPRGVRGAVPLLRAGHDTLAAAFGDTTYLRVRSGRVESPDTGRWDRLAAVEARMGLVGKFSLVYTDADSIAGWALVATSHLLESIQPLFYLPRPWNQHGGWIQRSQLRELYESFQKEKLQCLSEVA